MEPDNQNSDSFIKSIFHPSDFTLASENAFVHALALSLLLSTKFTILHVDKNKGDWQNFPAVRSTLDRWGLLEEETQRASLFDEFALRVKKVHIESNDPAKGILSYLRNHETDLIVLATEQRKGVPRWLQPSIAGKIAHRSKIKTLFVPSGSKGFVSYETGEFSLDKILIPIDRNPHPFQAIEIARRTASLVGNTVQILLVHVGTESTVPAVHVKDEFGIEWRRIIKTGNAIEALEEVSLIEKVDLIVMTTRGNQGFLDAMRGSVSDSILNRAHCPLLTVPQM